MIVIINGFYFSFEHWRKCKRKLKEVGKRTYLCCVSALIMRLGDPIFLFITKKSAFCAITVYLRFRLNPISWIAFRKSTVEGTYYLDENKGDFPPFDWFIWNRRSRCRKGNSSPSNCTGLSRRSSMYNQPQRDKLVAELYGSLNRKYNAMTAT